MVVWLDYIHHQHRRSGVAVTQIDLDDEALAEVMRASGHRTKKGAVNWALREVAARERRRHTLEDYAKLATDDAYERYLGIKAAEDAQRRG